MIAVNFLAASIASFSFLAPVTTIFPEAKIKAVVLGSRIRMTIPVNLRGLYSEFLVLQLICRRSSWHFKSTVATTFLENFNVFEYNLNILKFRRFLLQLKIFQSLIGQLEERCHLFKIIIIYSYCSFGVRSDSVVGTATGFGVDRDV